MRVFVEVIWPIGIYVSAVLGFLVGVIRWLRDPDMRVDEVLLAAVVGFLAGCVWPAWPLAVPAYGLYRLRRRLHPQLRIPLEEARRRPRP